MSDRLIEYTASGCKPKGLVVHSCAGAFGGAIRTRRASFSRPEGWVPWGTIAS